MGTYASQNLVEAIYQELDAKIDLLVRPLPNGGPLVSSQFSGGTKWEINK